MMAYRDIDGDSGVTGYVYGPNWIQVEFKDGSVYEYTNASAGQGNIGEMKRLADAGDGLNSFISKHVRQLYSRKL